MKKILVIHNKYRETGGEDIAVSNEIKLLEQKFKVKVLYFDNNISNLFLQSFYFATNRNKKSINLLKQLIDDFNPDIVYVHNTWFKASLGIFELLKNKNIKVILKLHNFRYFCTKSYFSKNHVLVDNVCEACGYKGSKRILNKYFNNSIAKSLLISRYGVKYFQILKNYDFKLLVLTNFHKKFLEDLNIDSEKIEIVPNFIKKYIHRENVESNYIVYAGRISKEKGIEELLEIFLKAKINGINLKIIGSGPDLNKLREKYKDDSINFLGKLNNEETIELIKHSLAVVTATKLFEGQPTLLCEASSLGVPSIFPRTGGISEFFPSNYPLSFEQFNYQDLLAKLLKVQDIHKMKKIGISNHEYISDYLDQEKLLHKFWQFTND
jgi:glycosyltransferase involved in cell wall biosynthesis